MMFYLVILHSYQKLCTTYDGLGIGELLPRVMYWIKFNLIHVTAVLLDMKKGV